MLLLSAHASARLWQCIFASELYLARATSRATSSVGGLCARITSALDAYIAGVCYEVVMSLSKKMHKE
jgi:hypothetical protein